MDQSLVPSHRQDDLAPIIDQAREYIAEAKAANTRKAYASDWRNFTGWCDARGCASLPASPETVALYLTTRAERDKVSTLTRRLATISQAHQAAGHPSPASAPLVRSVMQGIRRRLGSKQVGKAPVLTNELRRMIECLPDSLIGLRDRAILLLGFAAALRRSELVDLDVGDVDFINDGLIVRLRRSKTDQAGEGREIGVPYGSRVQTCPVRSLSAWITAGDITWGSLFRPITKEGIVQPRSLCPHSVARVVKKAAEGAGLDVSRYSGHSLRAGHATSAAAAGVSERAIMNQTGHRSSAMVRRYIRHGSLFAENSAASLGL